MNNERFTVIIFNEHKKQYEVKLFEGVKVIHTAIFEDVTAANSYAEDFLDGVTNPTVIVE